MANTITTRELEMLSNKAISAKSTAYCKSQDNQRYTEPDHNPPSLTILHIQKLTDQGPYSKFRVGASVLTHTGEYITGANVENVSFPVGTCAERVAFGTAVVSLPLLITYVGRIADWGNR